MIENYDIIPIISVSNKNGINIENLHKQNKILYSVSRELITSSSMDEIRSEWFRLIKLGFDGICTNYPLELQKFWMEVEKN